MMRPRVLTGSSSEALAFDLPDVLSRRTLLALNDVELDAITLAQRPEAISLNGRMMYEDVLRPVVESDKTEALAVIEPLHRSSRTHLLYLSLFRRRRRYLPPDAGLAGRRYSRPSGQSCPGARPPPGRRRLSVTGNTTPGASWRPSDQTKGPACARSLLRVSGYVAIPTWSPLLGVNIARPVRHVKRLCTGQSI